MTLLHVILWALHPMKPVLRLRAMLASFIAVLARTLGDDETRLWLEENPKHPRGLRLIEGSVALIEDLVQALIYHRAREILGLPACRIRRASRRPPAVLAGSPRALGKVLLRFERALWTLRNHEQFAQKRAAHLARLLEQRSLELETVHHPLPPLVVVVVMVVVVVVVAAASSTVLSPAGFSAQRIRAPPRLDASSGSSTPRRMAPENAPSRLVFSPPHGCVHLTFNAPLHSYRSWLSVPSSRFPTLF